MPVSVCESSINSAIRESITNSTNNYINSSGSKNNNDNDTAESIQNKLAASAKRVLLSKIEYEEVNNYGQSVLDTLKSKYIVLKPLNGSGKLINQQCNNNNDKDANQQNTTITATTTSGQQNGQQRFPNELPQPKRCLYPRENIQIGWRSSNRKWQVGAGMMNVGNTCYLNSTLQAVFHVPAMANWLMSDSAHREKCEDENGSQGGCIICAMAKTLIASQSNQSSAIRPYLVYTKLRLICKHLTMGRQEDAHEFLRYLVEAMEKSYLTRIRNYKELDQFSKETTPLNQILGGYLKSAVRCLACGHVSTTFQHFQDLLLDIRKANTVEEALDGYFARERLEDMGYKCEACKKKVSATKQFSLERAPISLCIQLKRFSMMGTKLNKHITIRPRLDLTKYSSSKKNNGETLTYKLVAMVTHLGASQHCGHYTAIGLTDAGGYYQFDDSCVRPISLQNVLNTNAYIIFYELDEQHQQTNNRQTSTQVSGDHEKYKENYNNKTNGHGNNNENLHNNQQQRVNLFSANNNIQNSKLISKLDVGGGDNSLSTTGNLNNNKNTNGNRLIGPQLPDEFKNLTTSNGCNNNNNKLTNTQSPNKYNNNNNNNNKTNGDSSLSKWMHSLKQQNTNSNKLVINFKNSTTNSTTMSTTLNGQLNNNKFQDTNGSTKLVNKIKTENNNNNDNNNDDYNKSTEIIKINNNKSTLPSMPKLLGSPKNEKSIINLNNDSTTINKNNNLGQLQNGLINSPIKSLVPYESDEDDDDNDNNNQKNYKTTEIQNGNNNNNNTAKRDISHDRMNNKINNKRKINNFNDDSSPDIKRSTPDSSPDIKRSSADSSPDIKRSKQTPPSPPVVKTKAGLWQVTPLEPIKPIINNGNTSSASSSYTTTATTNSERKNPFATTSGVSGVSVTNATSSKFNGKKIDNYSKKIPEDRGPTVTELLKYSHRGYGAPVLNWNGQKTDMEKEISEETRMERKRELEDDEENEMDRGKQKKVKIQGLHGSNNNRTVDNPGFNPFQEQQLQNNNQNRRWNAGNNHHSNNNRFQHQNNNAYRHNNNNNNHYNRNHNHNNNFRRNKYQQQQQQRSHHHQRNGGWR